MRDNIKQINISIPKEWAEQLERLARIKSIEQDKTLSHIDLIRTAIKDKYKLISKESN